MATSDTPARPGAVTEALEFLKLLGGGEFVSPFKRDPLEHAKSHIAHIERRARELTAALPAAASPEPVKWDSIGEPMTTRDWMQLARENAEKLADAQETIRELRAVAASPEPGADYAIVSAAERWASADESGNRLALVVAMRELREAVSAKRTAAAPRADATACAVCDEVHRIISNGYGAIDDHVTLTEAVAHVVEEASAYETGATAGGVTVTDAMVEAGARARWNHAVGDIGGPQFDEAPPANRVRCLELERVGLTAALRAAQPETSGGEG